MSYLFRMILLVVGEILRRYGLLALGASVVIICAVGGIAHLSGGSFLIAAKYCAEGLAVIGVVAVICTLFSALTKWG